MRKQRRKQHLRTLALVKKMTAPEVAELHYRSGLELKARGVAPLPVVLGQSGSWPEISSHVYGSMGYESSESRSKDEAIDVVQQQPASG